jgi:Flp pilus assembly protein TadG
MKMATQGRLKNQRGMAIFFYATMLVSVIGCVGLAVDVGTIYMIRARLVAAVDAAALAAGRSVNLANSVAQATTAASTTATQFFNANFPTGYFNSLGNPTVTPTFTQEADANGNPSGILDIQVTASVQAPTYFMNIFNVHSITVNGTGTASRRGVVLMLVLDQSSSMNTAPDPVSGLTACQAMIQAAGNFVNLFSPFDQIGLISFDITAHLLDSPTTNHTQVANDIANMAVTGCGSNTNTITALEVAYQQIKNTGLPLALNSIVLFTDGSPNGITAHFPVRAPAVLESRWGSTYEGGAQAGSTFGINNNCGIDQGNWDSVSGSWTNAICLSMPVHCTDSTQTFTGTLSQQGNQNSYGGDTYGLAPPVDGPDPVPPSSCTNYPGKGKAIREFIAYIPDNDIYGNSLHGVAATGTGPTVAGGLVTRDGWLFQVPTANWECSPDSNVQPNCKSTGDLITNYPGVLKTGSNFFPSTNALYANANVYNGFFRPDQANTIVAASMNGTMAEAARIRSDTTYHPVINVIYLTGNGSDSVDREFLPIVANAQYIIPLPYDSQYVANPVPPATPMQLYQNPAFQTGQESGHYLVTADSKQLTTLFAQLASEVLRLSH